MDFLKNRKTAVAIFVMVVILFSLLGCHRSLTKACKQVEDAFFDKSASQAENYYSCPAEQLEYCVRYANSLLAEMNGNLPDHIYNDVYSSRQALIAALETRDISDIFDAQTALTIAVEAAEREADSMGISTEPDIFTSLIADYMSAVNEAAASGYNDYVDEFMAGTANRFPTNILRRMTSVDMPEKYE